jgi:hypothetical protein
MKPPSLKSTHRRECQIATHRMASPLAARTGYWKEDKTALLMCLQAGFQRARGRPCLSWVNTPMVSMKTPTSSSRVIRKPDASNRMSPKTQATTSRTPIRPIDHMRISFLLSRSTSRGHETISSLGVPSIHIRNFGNTPHCGQGFAAGRAQRAGSPGAGAGRSAVAVPSPDNID